MLAIGLRVVLGGFRGWTIGCFSGGSGMQANEILRDYEVHVAGSIKAAVQAAPPVQVSPQASGAVGAPPTRGALPPWQTIQPILTDVVKVVAKNGLEYLGGRFGPAAALAVQAIEGQFPGFFGTPQGAEVRGTLLTLAQLGQGS